MILCSEGMGGFRVRLFDQRIEPVVQNDEPQVRVLNGILVFTVGAWKSTKAVKAAYA